MKEPDYVKQTLAWCNSMRARKGKAPLDRLPRGTPRDSDSCPCGKAAGVSVGLDEWWQGEGASIPLPGAVRAFVRAFDGGELPRYVERTISTGETEAA